MNDYHNTLKNNLTIKKESWLKSIFENYYWRSFIDFSHKNRDKYINETLKIIKEISNNDIKADTRIETGEDFKKIKEYLIGIQNYAEHNVEYRCAFDFRIFLNECLKIPIEKLSYIYNNIYDTIILLDRNPKMDKALKNKFYQIKFVKNNFEGINNYIKIYGDDEEDRLYMQSAKTLENDDLLKVDKIKKNLLNLRFLNLLLDSKNKIEIYNPEINYELFLDCSNELSKKLSDLVQNKTKAYFDELILFLVKYPEAFKIIHYYYPYNDDSLKNGELKHSNYYIYLFNYFYINKYNFSIRLEKIRYDIIFPEEDQSLKINPYFILNEEKSLNLSYRSYIKMDNDYHYFEKSPEENTKEMFERIREELDNSALKTEEEINQFHLETSNFFYDSPSTLISKILSLIINLKYEYPHFIEYLKQSCCFIEKDIIEKLNDLYEKLDKNNLNTKINILSEISFFCSSRAKSMIWKYRFLINSDKFKNIDKEYFYDYIKKEEKKINPEEEISTLTKEKNNLDKLVDFLGKNNIENYRAKLMKLEELLTLYKNKDKEDEEITELRNKANGLRNIIEEKLGNQSNLIIDNLKNKIIDFANSPNPKKEDYDKLDKDVTAFISDFNNIKKVDILNLPNKDDIETEEFDKYQKYDLLFWYCSVLENIETLFAGTTLVDETYFELIRNLYLQPELEPILTIINEKREEMIEQQIKEKENLPQTLYFKVMQMLRGILLTKLRIRGINLKDFNNIVKDINDKIYPNKISIDESEYNFSYFISNKYSKNLKISFPKFEIMDAFYLFFKYNNKTNKYKLGDIFKNFSLGGVNDIANEILEKEYNIKMDELIEKLGNLFYQSICHKSIKKDEKQKLSDFLKIQSGKEDNELKQKMLNLIAYNLDFIKSLEENIINMQADKDKKDNYIFKLNDFDNLLEGPEKEKKLMNCSNIFQKEKVFILEKNKKSVFSPSFIYYLNNNQKFINRLFDDLNKSNKSIIYDLNKGREIDYLPFWLFVLRNITSLNFIKYDDEDISTEMARKIIIKIKTEITQCLMNENPLNSNWINLILNNISPDIVDHKIHSFYTFFNSLFNNLILTQKHLKEFTKNELVKYFEKVIEFVIKNDIDKLFEENINTENKEPILKFIKNPNEYLFEKIQEHVKKEFCDTMEKFEIFELSKQFLKEFNELANSFIEEIKEANKQLLQNELEKKIDEHLNNLARDVVNLCNKNFDKLTVFEKKIADSGGNFINAKISDKDLKELIYANEKLKKYKENGIKENENKKIIYLIIKYDFSYPVRNEFYIKFLDKEIKIDPSIKERKIYLICNQINKELKIDSKIIKNISIEKEYTFPKFEVDDHEKIKNFIKDLPETKLPKEKDIKNPPIILLSDNTFDVFHEKLEKFNSAVNNWKNVLKGMKENKEFNKDIISQFEDDVKLSADLLDQMEKMLIINMNEFEQLNNFSKKLKTVISPYNLNLKKYYEEYNNNPKKILFEYFEIIKKKEIFLTNLDFSLPVVPEIIAEKINYEKMNEKSENLFIPIINYDNEGKKLISSFDSLDLNLGKTFPYLYENIYIINIISYINEDINVTLDKYNEKKIAIRDIIKEERVEIDEKILNNYLTLKENFVKKGENIQLLVRIPESIEEETYKLSGRLKFKTSSNHKLELKINITLTIIPISILFSCKEYKLLYIKAHEEYKGNFQFQHYFKLNTNVLLEKEELNFELLNYRDKDSIEFYISAKALSDNTSFMPEFENKPQNKKCKIIIPEIPEYKTYNDKKQNFDFRRLQCKLEIVVNKYFITIVEIDALIKPNINIFKMYDFISKTYKEKEIEIPLNKYVQYIFQEKNKKIELKCRFYSSFEGEEFSVEPKKFPPGGKITNTKGKIKGGFCEFSLFLELIKSETIPTCECLIDISIKNIQQQFKIKFLNESNHGLKEKENYLDFEEKEKNEIKDDMNEINEKKIYLSLTSFKLPEIEIDCKRNQIKDLYFYYINKNGEISKSDKYEKKNFNPGNWYMFATKELKNPFCLKYKNNWYPLTDNYKKIYGYYNLYLENWEKIKADFNKWENKIKEDNFKDIIEAISSLPEYKNEKRSDKFYQQCEKILTKKITTELKEFIKKIGDFEKNTQKEDITFEGLAYHIMFNTKNTLNQLHNIFPDDIKAQLNSDFNYYNNSKGKDEKDLALYNYIIRFQEIFNEREKQFSSNGKKIKILDTDLNEKNLLNEFFKIDQINALKNESNSLYLNFENELSKLKKRENDSKPSEKYLIVGSQCNPVDREEKQKINDLNEKLQTNLKKFSVNVVLPKIEINKYKNDISLNQFIELYNNLAIGSRIFPAYLIDAKINDKIENLKEGSEYFDILFSFYLLFSDKGSEYKNNSIISIKVNDFISSFKDMIIKLKQAGVSFNSSDSSNFDIKNKYSFITHPKKHALVKLKNQWENEKFIIKNKSTNIGNIEKIGIDNMGTTILRNYIKHEIPIKEEPINPDLSGIDPIVDNSGDDEEDIEKMKNVLLKMNDKDNVIINFEDEEEQKIKPNKIDLSGPDTLIEKSFSKVTTEIFEKKGKLNEDSILLKIIDKMKNKVNKNDEKFNYEKTDDLKPGFKIKNKGYDKLKDLDNIEEINKIKNLPISKLIEDSRFLISKIYSRVAQMNNDEENKEIPFKKLEANIIVDLTKSITDENRYFNMLLICGLTIALNSLKINYTLSLMGDSDFKVRIKTSDKNHSMIFLQKLYDCYYIKRNITEVAACLRYFIDKYPPKDNTMNRVYYIFTNGYDIELIKKELWVEKIFNDRKNSFSFIFTKSQVLEKESNSNHKKYLEQVWEEFEVESKKSLSIVNLTKISFEEIKILHNLEQLVQNLSEVLLREKAQNDSSPLNNALFNYDNSAKLKTDYINDITGFIKDHDKFAKEKFNEIYIKKIKLPNIYGTKDKKDEYKKFCQQTGKMIRYNNIDQIIQNNILKIVKDFKEKMKFTPMNIIFKPNLPTQAILVEEGTRLDITELIKYLINKVPNPKLYREIRDGFVKNYGVSVIIDTSISCLNELSITHTLHTLRILLSAISNDNLPCLDIIATRDKEPLVLSSEKSANEILSEKSPFWPVLFSLFEGIYSSDLASAIKAAYNLIKARRADYTSFIFVLTDGLYSISERDRIIRIVNSCYSKNINLFGIGTGICPIGIEKLFSQVIYSRNPYKLIEGISYFFGDISKFKDNKMTFFDFNFDEKSYNENKMHIEEHKKNPIFKLLKEELKEITIKAESYLFYKEEEILGEGNPEGNDLGMYEKNLYLGQKILIAMFFSCDLKSQRHQTNTDDERRVHPNNIKNKEGKEECISSALEYYGYETVVVTDYEKAINELCKTNKDEKCIYNSLWVISGQKFPDLPDLDKNEDKNAPLYVEQFVDCAIQFWKNGGSLVLLGENDPYNFQVNLFLEKLVFPNGNKCNFKIEGNHEGGNILFGQELDNGQELKSGRFNRTKQKQNNNERKSLGNNLKKIFEGKTIAYATSRIKDNYKPFIPFSKDYEGGVNSLFYNGSDMNNDGKGEGDIFIDCSYTKFFMNMSSEGTARYVQNIGGFIGSYERREKNEDFPDACSFRPEKVEFKLDKSKLYIYPKIPYDIVYLVDATGSMQGEINSVIDYCKTIAEILKKNLYYYDFQFGAVFYRDPIDTEGSDEHECFGLTPDIVKFQNDISGIIASGGNDISEDWVGGYDCALHMNWRNGNKLIIHIADAGAHGTIYSVNDKYDKEGDKLDKKIRECIEKNIIIVGFKIENEPDQSFNRIKYLYKSYGNENNVIITELNRENKNVGYFTDLVVNSITKVT